MKRLLKGIITLLRCFVETDEERQKDKEIEYETKTWG